MGLIVGIITMVILLLLSAMVSGSEVAFFSISPRERESIGNSSIKNSKLLTKLLSKPEQLLGTILVANNFINICFVILSTYITKPLFETIDSDILVFVLQIVVVTFLILLFGELMPKVLANKYPRKYAGFMAAPIYYCSKVLYPITAVLCSGSNLINRKLRNKKQNISMDELSQAIELASDDLSEEKDILEGIVKFGNITVKEIMKPRLDVIALDYNDSFTKVISVIVESGYSRIPVYKDNFDNISGILYIKDLLPYLKIKDKAGFMWQKLIRKHYYVPETKRINDLLEEFQLKKIHMAIVIDEYGGTSGIVTLEDILEEIVGEITDESDTQDNYYIKLDENKYVFDARISINDFTKVMDCDTDYFDEIKGDSDSLAGLILEVKGEMPEKKEVLTYHDFRFIIKAVDNRRIKKIQVDRINEED